MQLRRLLSTLGLVLSHSPADEDVVMSDATKAAITATTSCPAVITPSHSTSRPSLLGKRRHVETSEPISQHTPMASSALSEPTSVPSPSTEPPASARKRYIFTLAPIDTTPDPSPSELNSPAPTEIALDVPEYIEPTPEERIRALQAAGIKVRDYAYEPQPSTSKAPEVFDPLPSLIATDWHMRNPEKNHGMLSGKALFRLIKVGWVSMSEVAKRVHVREYSALAQYSDRPDDGRYPFVLASSEPMPTPSQRVRMRRNAGFRSHPDDLPDREFFGYDPTGHSDEEQPAVQTETEASGEPKVKRRKLRSRAKPLRRTKGLRKECSRPEV
ncbi:hypothetical protein EDB83DRAFT_2397145 [Lactarius deliciosus]|nr:hypothetical protein EDB83DRAFT_2397145 [Lactarius deliciosus]